MKADFKLRKKMEGINPCAATVSRKISKTSNKKKHCSSQSTVGDKDKAEIKAYLNKLQELVPFMPKDKKLSKVEVISNVIEYIRELRVTLGLPPCSNSPYPDFKDIDMIMDHSSPALLMTMTMMRNGEVEHSSSVNLTTSISGATPVSTAPNTPIASVQQSNLSGSRQPLGVILNPRNCSNGTLLPSPAIDQGFPNSTISCAIPTDK